MVATDEVQDEASVQAVTQRIAEAMDAFCAMGQAGSGGALEVVAVATTGDVISAMMLRDLLTLPPPAGSEVLVQHGMLTGKPVLIEPTWENLKIRFGEAGARRFLSADIHSILFVPLRVKERGGGSRIIGAFSVIRHGADARPFTETELRFADYLAAHAALALTNGRLEVVAQRQRDRIDMQSAMTREFALATGDYARLLEVIALRLGTVVGDFATIRLLSEDGEWFEGSAATYHADPVLRAYAKELLQAVPQRATQGVAGLAISRGGSVLLPEVDLERRTDVTEPHHFELIQRLEMRTILATPLRNAGRLTGVVIVSRRTGSFNEADQQLLEDLAAHASVAITNARLLAEAATEIALRKKIAERLRVLTDASKEFSASIGDPKQLLDLVTRRLAEAIGDLCVLRLVAGDEVSMELDGSAHSVRSEAEAESVRVAMRAMPQRVGQGLSGQVVASGKVMRVNAATPDELADLTDPVFRAYFVHMGITCIIGIPMQVRGVVIGVITLSRVDASRPFSEDDVAFAQDLVTHATLAVKNTRLVDAVRRTEDQLRQAQKMEAIGRLAGGVAHDFNNLLSVVLSYCTLITEELPSDDPMLDSIDQIRMAGERAADLTRQLLAFSRQQVIEPVVLDVGKVIGKLDKMLERMCGEDIELRFDLGRETGRIKADPGHVEQVIMNLVVNARDAMPTGGVLTVATSNVDIDETFARTHVGFTPGPHVRIAISDTGSGMDQATQERIFEPFFTTKAKGKGTGLGLSTVFGIVKQSGGSIWVESEVGKGSRFEVYLRRSEEVVKRPRLESGPGMPPLRTGDTILLVEDDAQVRMVARGILKRHGYRLLEARRGSEAIEMCRAHEGVIDLLLTDVVMPHMSGRELAEAIQPLRPAMRVLYMSGYTEDAILEHRVVAAGVELLQKPLTPDALLKKVRAVLDGGRARPM